MKKTSIVVFVIAGLLLLTSCGGVNDFNTPKDVIGEWTGSSTTEPSSVVEYANSYSGTYTMERTIANSEYEDSTQDYNGYVNDVTYRTYNDPISNKITFTRTVSDDYSYTEETKIVTTVAARAAIAAVSTGSLQTAGDTAWTAAVKTTTRNVKVTVVQNPDGSYIEKRTTTYTVSSDSDYFHEYDSNIGVTVSTTPQSLTTTATYFINNTSGLSYNSGFSIPYYTVITPVYSTQWVNYNYVQVLTGYTHTTATYNGNLSLCTKTAATVTTTYSTKRDYSLTVGEDGTYTLTYTSTAKYTEPQVQDVVYKLVETGMATGSGTGYLTLNCKKTVYTLDGSDVTKESNTYSTYEYYIVNKTLQIDGFPTLALVEPAK